MSLHYDDLWSPRNHVVFFFFFSLKNDKKKKKILRIPKMAGAEVAIFLFLSRSAPGLGGSIFPVCQILTDSL